MKKHVVFLLFFYSCIRVEIPPNETPDFAVIGLVSPSDSLINILVSTVTKIGKDIDPNNSIVKICNVTIFGNGISKTLIYNPQSQRYEAQNGGFIKYGAEYSLVVDIPNKIRLKSKCKVSANVDVSFVGNYKEGNYYIQVKWADNRNEKNTYNISASYPQKDSIIKYINWTGAITPYLELNDTEAVLDFKAEGLIKNISSLQKPLTLSLYFSNIENNTALFFEARKKQYNQTSSLQQSISQFVVQAAKNDAKLSDFFERFKEPELLPLSNIENGLGFFGSYYTKSIPIHINSP
jgi:Domain of unknown function (DUF4249)